MTSMEDGFSAFWADARMLCDDRAGLRQGFKNGACFVYSRGLVRGREAILDLIRRGEVYTLRQMWPSIALCLQAHPEWGEVHRDAVIAGSFTAVTLLRTGAPLGDEIDRFVP